MQKHSKTAGGVSMHSNVGVSRLSRQRTGPTRRSAIEAQCNAWYRSASSTTFRGRLIANKEENCIMDATVDIVVMMYPGIYVWESNEGK